MGSCGAFSGGLMALSSRFCPHSEDLSDEEIIDLEEARPNFFELRDWFIKEFSGVTCSNVIRKLFGRSYDLHSEEEREELRKVQEELGFDCRLVIEKVAVKTAEILMGDS